LGMSSSSSSSFPTKTTTLLLLAMVLGLAAGSTTGCHARTTSSSSPAYAAFWGGRGNKATRKPGGSGDGSSTGSTDLSSVAAAAATTAAAIDAGASHDATTSVPKFERGKVLGDGPITAEVLYGAYKDVQRDYADRAFHNPNWKVLNRKKDEEHGDVEVAMLQHPSDPNCPYVRMKATMPVSVQECWNFLLVERWDETMPRMDPFYEGVSTHGEFRMSKDRHMLLCRKRTKRILTFGKRDLVFVSVQDTPLDDGTWVSGSVSVVTPTLPRQPGYTRAFQDSIAFYKPKNGNTSTDVTIICRIDLNDSSADGTGGCIPMWLYTKTIGTTGAQSIKSMRSALIADRQKRLAREKKQQLEAASAAAAVVDDVPTSGPWWRRRNK